MFQLLCTFFSPTVYLPKKYFLILDRWVITVEVFSDVNLDEQLDAFISIILNCSWNKKSWTLLRVCESLE